MKRPKKQSSGRQFASVSGSDMDSAMFWFGDLNAWGAFPTTPTVYQKPRSQVFYVTRNWFERQVFVKSITQLRFSLYHYGFQIVSRDKKTAKQVETWSRENQMAIASFERDAWMEWLVQDNAIAVWSSKRGRPLIYPTEHCSYQDDFAIERLSFAHGIAPEAVSAMPGLSDGERLKFAQSKELTISKQGNNYMDGAGKLFGFEVLKRTRVGLGLAWPQLRSIFNTMATWEGMEMADWKLADALRTVYELHQIGHEIKNGVHSGSAAHFLKKKRADAVGKIIKNDKRLQARIIQLLVNFDHQITYPRPDPKHFGVERYSSVMEKLMIWAMPLAQMIFTKALNPALMPLFKAQVMSERDLMRPFLEQVLRNSLKMPADGRVVWGEELFWDSRLLMQILKDGLTNGPLSQQTWMEKSGFDPERERENKETEHKLAEHLVKPVYDSAHGNHPSTERGGRPAGGGDKKKRNAKGQ